MSKPSPYVPSVVSRPAPPAYVPQPSVQLKEMASGAPGVYRPVPGLAPAIQPKSLLPLGATIQLKGNKCTVCNHRHGSSRCRVKNRSGAVCGCTSHSGHWEKGSTVNPGSGRHERMLERMRGGR